MHLRPFLQECKRPAYLAEEVRLYHSHSIYGNGLNLVYLFLTEYDNAYVYPQSSADGILSMILEKKAPRQRHVRVYVVV